jgi:hypothetical protein
MSAPAPFAAPGSALNAPDDSRRERIIADTAALPMPCCIAIRAAGDSSPAAGIASAGASVGGSGAFAAASGGASSSTRSAKPTPFRRRRGCALRAA